MATPKETAINSIVANVATLCDCGSDSALTGKIRVFANRYYDSACGYTGYTLLPDALLSFVEDAVVQAFRKRGAEGLNSQSAAGISETYLDVAYALRQNLRFKRNPNSAVGTDESGAENA